MMNYFQKTNLEQLWEEFPHWFDVVKKDSSSSRSVRDLGNKLYCKKNHDWEIHSRILSTYSQSAAIAPNGSEELALAYGNRSALLLHLKRYDECLIDIERACEITKSAALKDKLEARRAQCLSFRSEGPKSSQDQQTESVIRLKKKFKPSKEIPCSSSSVSIQMDAKNRRHIVATQDIEPGTIIVIEKSAAAIPINDCMFLNCDRCLKFAWNGVPCDSCTNVIFCSEKCKKGAWSEYHDIECVIFSLFSVIKIEYASHIKLAFRIFIKSVKHGGLESMIKDTLDVENNKDLLLDQFFDLSSFHSNKFKSIISLTPNENDILQEKRFVSAVIDFLAVNPNQSILADNCNIMSVKKCVIKLLSAVTQNSLSFQYLQDSIKFPISTDVNDKNKNQFGTIIAPFSSLFNHSCCSNVGKVVTGDQEVVLYTQTVIRKGEQLYLCYGPNINMKKVERQRFLKEKFNFTCECQICKENCEITNFREKINMKLSKKIYSKLERLGINQIPEVQYKLENNIICSDNVLEDTVKALKVVHQNCTGIQAILQSFQFVYFFQKIFSIWFGVNNAVPNTC